MNIMITGIGGVGGYLAGVLCHAAEHHITLIARKKRKESLEQKGLVIHSDLLGEHVFHPTVTDTPADVGVQDIIFVCVKQYSLASALAPLAPCIDSHTIVVPVLNGVDNGQRVRAAYPHCHVVETCIYITAAYLDDYSIRQYDRYARMFFGSTDASSQAAAKTVTAVLDEPGMQAITADDITAEIWKKYILNCAYNGITAYYKTTIGGAFAQPNGLAEFRQLLQEAYDVGIACGVRLKPDLVQRHYDRVMKQPNKNVTSSLARDIMHGAKQTELDTFSGYLVRTAKEHGVAVPLSEKCYETISTR